MLLTTGSIDSGQVKTIDDVHSTALGCELVDLIIHTLVFGALLGLVVRGLSTERIRKLGGHAVARLGGNLGRRWEAAVLERAAGGDHGGWFGDWKRPESTVRRIRVVRWVSREGCRACVVGRVGTDGDDVGEGS